MSDSIQEIPQEQEEKNYDRLTTIISNLDRVIDGATKLGVAYLGAKQAGHWTGALTGLVALKLATGGNLVGGALGIGLLAIIGIKESGITLPTEPALSETLDPYLAEQLSQIPGVKFNLL